MVDCFLILCLLSIINPGKFDTTLNTPDVKADTNLHVIQMGCECFDLNQVKHVKFITNTYLYKFREEFSGTSKEGSKSQKGFTIIVGVTKKFDNFSVSRKIGVPAYM